MLPESPAGTFHAQADGQPKCWWSDDVADFSGAALASVMATFFVEIGERAH